MKSIDASSESETDGSGGTQLLRRLPAVNQVLQRPEIEPLFRVYGRDAVRVQLRELLEDARRRVLGQDLGPSELDSWIETLPGSIAAGLEARFGGRLRRVINATGVFLHTNLGRAPLPRAVVDAMPRFLDAYCDLEMDLEDGKRANRNQRAESLLCELTGAEAGLVVNNNAAALVLLLQCAARGREVIVSRGELVEIGGSFRIPSILETAGARLREVGTTNRTRVADYEQAIGPETGALLKVHPSNYVVSGFVEEVTPAELVELGRRHDLPVLVDEGSGLLRPSRRPQLRDHDSLQTLVGLGVDAACGSGDKLVGGPQAGLIVGRRDFVERLKKHPLYRALRPNRATLFALDAVLRLHLAGSELPLERLWTTREDAMARLEPVAEQLGADVVESDAYVGGGAAPESPIAGWALSLPGSSALLAALRVGETPVVGYLREGRLVLDLRTVDPHDDRALVSAVLEARRRLGGEEGAE